MLLAVVVVGYVVATTAPFLFDRSARRAFCRSRKAPALGQILRPANATKRGRRPPTEPTPFDRVVNTIELWYVRRGMQAPMQDTEYVEIRVYQQARGAVAVAAVDVPALKHILGSQLFLANAQTLLQKAMGAPDAKERLEALERALPLPLPPAALTKASLAPSSRAAREELRARRRSRRP